MTAFLSQIGTATLSPRLIIGEADHRLLTALALAGIGHDSDETETLLYELERAEIVPEPVLPDSVVRMGSTVTYRPEIGRPRTVTLVYPANADIAQGRISVLTPVGTALIGLNLGQSITWHGRDGKKHVLTVLDVAPPSGEVSPGAPSEV